MRGIEARQLHLALARNFLEALGLVLLGALLGLERLDDFGLVGLGSIMAHAVTVAHEARRVFGQLNRSPFGSCERDHRFPARALFGRDEGDARALTAAVASAANAVDPLFRRHRHIVIHDQADSRHMQSARRDIGCNKHAAAAMRE